MKNLNIKIIYYKSLKLIKFLNNIKESDFLLNKSFKNTPWIYLKNPNFTFYKIENSEKILGVAVIFKIKKQDHLQFFYIDKNYRSSGIGKLFLKKVLRKKKFTTVHVYKNLKRNVLRFYEDNGFKLYNFKKKKKKLELWIKRCNKFKGNTFKEKYLLYKN